ncbi:NAD(P)H-binding protein [Amycolatopsis endophytica]|uniref:Uncharacterized protein YbjT (DUF2867 family) n=1 Tax=Amycolatopsis endophytica TaxID=860233 RepID=A0A853AWE7_9PSEU|nr:NAD(P)H-binding protein [Amycolatopsis endophytica]NYI87043.1 uncharacterized protein YbjT (DUF2867 family) [Amycolatopsis endophytica]
MIVITTPTGNIGHQVLGHVLAAGRPVRVIARNPSGLPGDVRDRAEVIPGSHGDPEVLARALDGAEAVFWLAPGDRRATSIDDVYRGFTRPALEALSGVQRVVDVSALGRGTPYAGQAGHVTASLAMDDLIADTGVAFRALAAASFMDNVLRQARSIAEQGTFFDVLSPDRALPWVATRDIAAVAARLLLDGTWTGRGEVPLLGPEHLSYAGIADIVSEVLDKPVRYEQIPAETLYDAMTGSGASEAQGRAMVEMATAKEKGLDDGVARTPRHATDTPTTFRQWCEDVLAPAVRQA